MKYLISIFIVFGTIPILGQSSYDTLSILVSYGDRPLEMGEHFALNNSGDSIKISKLKFYISVPYPLGNVDNKQDYSSEHHLFDLSQSSTLDIPIKYHLSSSVLVFSIGVDSITNVSGAQGAALDPMHGMYWTWNSGYINFKIEGVSSLCPTRKNKFLLHLGGFQKPNNAFRKVEIPITKTVNKKLRVEFALDSFLKQIDLSKTHTIMSPSKEAMRLADLISKSFQLKDE